ncbi:hypothetical protein PV05_07790 [Exophiala xenobiotica]|uniref:GPI anchored protein n=1 Tax=Exophiala xenobiotica TaxID=348802 RepID=A0A0D2EBR4_9EURO|nr:uncharacterized protein PV05_07790 [Exophiala xenobiotica]KIW52125.1 hypothetical protein PV05_07790 [Exophiala xenobiotica]
MAPWLHLAALPSSLLVFIASSALPACSQDLDWPYSLPPDVKYYPEDEFLVKRDMDIQKKLQRHAVTGIRKMSHDPGEKFYLAYWGMAEEGQATTCSSTWSNASLWTSFEQPIRVHSHPQTQTSVAGSWRLPGWHLLFKRGFQCPSGTSSCTSIDRPNSCCATGSTCQIVQDTGLGDVGCCPNGQTCADSLSTCESGYTSCPNNPGGGCCIPGYACYDVGCVQTSYATVSTQPAPTPSTTTVTSYTTITPPVTSPTTTSTSRSSSSSSSPTTTLAPDISTVTKTVTVTSTLNTLTCSSGYRSCPASLGGGCCPTDRSCGSASCPASTTTTSATAAPPVRPTTLTTTEETTTTTLSPSGRSATTSSPTRTSTSTSASSSVSVTGCPTGFYACSAYYLGGCCQIGRNCDTTSCPASVSTTLVSGSTLTIVAPSGSGITAPASVLTGACAKGWATCAADLGGGCCPSGYQCGEVSCAAVATGGSSVGKMPPNAAPALAADLWTMIAGLGMSLAGMVVMTL